MNDYKVNIRGTEEEVEESQRVELNHITAPHVALKYPLELREHSFPRSHRFLKSALALKAEVIQATWMKNGPRVSNPTLYVGTLGTAFMCFKAYLTTGSKQDLIDCCDIVDSCCAAAMTVEQNVTFLRGQPGIYALGAAAAKCRHNEKRLNFFLNLFDKVASQRVLSAGPAEAGHGLTYELHFGRVGFLYAALFINRFIGEETVPWCTLGPVVDAVMAAGRAGATLTSSPLMYTWKGTRYLGASHGLAGILHILMHFPLNKADHDDVKGALKYLLRTRYFRGNYPSNEHNTRGDLLVHWCHGAPGVAITLCKAAEVYPEEEGFRQAAIDAAEVVWQRGLLRRLGLCHGVSGNAYVFLSLYRQFGSKKHLFHARQFAGFLHKHAHHLIANGEMNGGDHPFSLFEGLAGTVCLWLDVTRPDNSQFPAYEI
ncbi:hypothetical protein CY35_06G044100 [Sphagnum magellanicum]|nr:hypothetical protein CY35_06G044100 [Sphagnum magellanicum]